MKKILIILPDHDYDTTETSVPWRILTNAGCQVEFSTVNGQVAECDPLLLTGVIFGQLGASEEAKKFYGEMKASKEFQKPTPFTIVDFFAYDAIILPGGHAPGMRPYLEDTVLREKIIPYINDQSKIVGAICHGTIVLARATDPSTGKSLLYKRKSTCLPKYMEQTAFYLTRWKLGKYYRTYEAYVEDELKAAMENPKEQFEEGTKNRCGSLDEKYAFVCIDKNYISARWPGDAYLFANTILNRLNEKF